LTKITEIPDPASLIVKKQSKPTATVIDFRHALESAQTSKRKQYSQQIIEYASKLTW